MIVAWHEVRGTAPPQKSRLIGYGMIRAGVCLIRRLKSLPFAAGESLPVRGPEGGNFEWYR